MARPPHQLKKLAELLDVAPSDLLNAIILTVDWQRVPPSGMVNLQVRVPKPGQREMPFREDSRLSQVANTLHLEPEAIREAMIAMYPHIEPGNTVTFQVRARTGARDLIIPELPYAEDAAERGDRWAIKWLRLARRVLKEVEE